MSRPRPPCGAASPSSVLTPPGKVPPCLTRTCHRPTGRDKNIPGEIKDNKSAHEQKSKALLHIVLIGDLPMKKLDENSDSFLDDWCSFNLSSS